jgi:L-serine dehydratase
LLLLDTHAICFDPDRDILFLGDQLLPEHPNALKLQAFGPENQLLKESCYFSVGGGFVVERGADSGMKDIPGADVPFPFSTCDRLVELCEAQACSMADIVLANEMALRAENDIRRDLLSIWKVMQECTNRGLGIEEQGCPNFLPGVLKLQRRAPALHARLMREAAAPDPLSAMDWVNAFAMAVNEENAAGGRVVTAPTNGAAGIVPAVLHYYARFIPGANDEGVCQFLLTAAAIGILYKTNASISGAEVGCQGEVGVACSMAAGALAAVMGGTPRQVENAAEIGMEHNLGLTCDPVGGLVQIPCVERNAMGGVKAINAARLALRGDGSHSVSLDEVIRTMKQTGDDMKSKYKETSLGGLAVNVAKC